MCKFFRMLEKRWDAGARVCVGLDSDKEKIPQHLTNLGRISRFNIDIVEATKDMALAYKPNIAFYSGKGGYPRMELQRTIEGISSKVLASELKDLELNGFIKRRVYAETPIVIEYELTDYALTVQPVLGALAEWGSMHRKKIRQRMKQEYEASRK